MITRVDVNSVKSQEFREASMYMFREMLFSPPQRRLLEQLLSVGIVQPGRGKKEVGGMMMMMRMMRMMMMMMI
jgi:hypothetical protein